MDQESLRQRLAQLHAELRDAHREDPDKHRPLEDILPEIERLTKSSGSAGAGVESAALPQRLERVAVQFEAEHPSLAGSVRRIVDLLGEIGI